jgi:hypothetical protein
MTKLANAAINSFASHPTRADFVPPEDPILEVPLSELQGLLNEMLLTHNLLAEMVRDAGILRGRELARITEKHATSLKAEKSPLTKILLLNAYIRQFLIKVRDRLKSMPTPENSKVVQVCSKIMARAIQIIDYIKCYGEDDPHGKRDVSLDSQGARLLFSGKTGEPVSRRDTIRAMKRAEALWPALHCGHRPNDGRQTMRLTINRDDLGIAPEFSYRDTWQRSRESVGLSL